MVLAPITCKKEVSEFAQNWQIFVGLTERQVPIFSYFSEHTPTFPIF